MNESKNTTDNQSFTNELQLYLNNELVKLAKSELSFKKAIPSIQSLFSETFHFVESQFFFDNPEFTDLNKAAQSSEIFLTIIRNLVENGILDWVLEQNTVQILPNLDLTTNEIFQKVLIYPLKRKQSNVFFIATLAQSSMLHNYKDLENLPNIFELSLMIILNSYLQEIGNNFSSSKKSPYDSSYFKLIYSAARSSVVDYLIQGLRTFTKAISAQLQFLVTDNIYSERRIKILEEYIGLTTNYLNKISRLQDNEFNPSKVDLKSLLSEITDILKPICKTSEVSISFACDNDNYFLNIDRNCLEIALFCIIINSIESIDNYGNVSIMLQRTENRRIALNIIDNGSGIVETDLPKIFNAMWTSKDSRKHLGIGLTYVQHFLDGTNAKFSVSSDATKGTNFKIVFGNTIL